LLAVVYAERRRVARNQMRREPAEDVVPATRISAMAGSLLHECPQCRPGRPVDQFLEYAEILHLFPPLYAFGVGPAVIRAKRRFKTENSGEKMLSQKRPSVTVALMVCGLLGVSAAHAQGPSCFTAASLQGNYAVIGTYGANVAIAFGMRYFDGNGNLTGTYVVNEPKAGSTTGERVIVSGTQKGSYTVNCDGTGVINRTITLPDGSTQVQADDFIITATFREGWVLIATSMMDAQRVPSAVVTGGIFLTRSYTRLPDRPQQ
jgi:hypothetical protein